MIKLNFDKILTNLSYKIWVLFKIRDSKNLNSKKISLISKDHLFILKRSYWKYNTYSEYDPNLYFIWVDFILMF